ncbi:hypothetical protein MKW92_026298 [Papaver armeniacum]|nr:hypothetical protein MKW92_026298 [Papaver armeniacum]
MLLSSVFIRLTGVSSLTHFTTTQSAPPCYRNDETHYQHGIFGIPTDGKVVLLKNSNTGSQVYLVGTNHFCKESPQFVKKVNIISYSVKPQVVAIEQTKKETEKMLKNPRPEAEYVNESWFSMFVRSMKSPGDLGHKIWMFEFNRKERQRQADGIIRGGEFKVAIEECLKLNAKLVPIDRELGHRALWKDKSKEHLMEKGSRSYYKLFIEDRDKHMFTMLRRMEERLIVAVVGMGHMDGIELLWKRAEDGDDDKLLLATSENGVVSRELKCLYSFGTLSYSS